MADKATKFTQVGTVIVPVSNPERALEFYLGTLGFEIRLDAPFGDQRWVEVAPPGASTTIALIASPEKEIVVSFTTTDADGDHAALRARGVSADEAVMRMGDYVPPMFAFTDPDGNRFRVVERPPA